MRILELHASPWWTGPAEPMASVARHLAARGHAVEVAVDTAREGDLRDRLRALGLAVRDDLALSTKAGPIAWARDAVRLRRLAAGLDVLHAHFSHDHALALLARPRRSDVRLVRTVHSARSLARRAGQGWAHRRSDGLLAVCEAHARLLAERFGVPERRIGLARGAVDAATFSPDGPDLRAELGLAPGAPVAGIVSRVKPERRHADLLEAFGAVARALPEARLVIVGRGEGLPALRAQVEARGLAGAVVFAGYRAGAALASAYRTLDVKVLLAEGNDGTCRALLEAMACGRPAIAYRFGAPGEVIADGDSGLLVPEGDVEALGAALVDVLSAPARAQAMGARARARVAANYTEASRAEAVERFLAEIGRLPPA
jgi:glycosyltransferase involved in cell wall biosynthesis